MEHLFQDFKFGFRILRKNPGFAIVAILTLALAIGANTAIFTMVNAIAFKAPPGIADPATLVDVGRRTESGLDTVSYPNYVDYRARNGVFSGLLAYTLEPTAMSIRAAQGAERVYGMTVSGNYFEVLGVTPALGRFFLPEEDRTPATHPVAVIGFDLWRNRFASDPEIAGKTVHINGYPFTVIGVAPDGFKGPNFLQSEVWVPLMMRSRIRTGRADLTENRLASWLFMIGRLKPGVSAAQAQAAMTVLARQLEAAYPTTQDRGVEVAAMSAVPGRIQLVLAFMGVLITATGLILAVACANVAGMMLARATARRREIAVRMAIGASRRRLLSQLVAEGMILFVIAGIGGLLASIWATDLLLSFRHSLPAPVAVDLSIDWRVLAFSLLVSLLTGVGTGLLPALHAARKNFAPALKEEAGATGYRRLRLRSALVVAQVALSMLLLVGGGLFVRTLQYASQLDPGFDPANVDIVDFDLFIGGYRQETGVPFAQQLTERVAALPGVHSVSFAIDLPLDGGRHGLGGITVPGHEPPPGQREFGFGPDWNVIAPGYFRTMGIPMAAGRDFSESDRIGAPKAAIVNEAMARRFWPNEDPIGKVILNEGQQLHIVGVAKDIKYNSLTEETPLFVYVAFAQRYNPRIHLIVRTAGASAVPQIREIVQELNPNLPVVNASSLEEVIAFGLIPQRLAAWVSGTLGLAGLFLTAIGLYGITAYAIGQRTKEIGIRIALGAQPARVLHVVVREGVGLAALGSIIGLGSAFVMTRFLSDFLVGIDSTDPLTFGAAIVLFAGTAILASFIPARRATRVDPVIALRCE